MTPGTKESGDPGAIALAVLKTTGHAADRNDRAAEIGLAVALRKTAPANPRK